MLAAFSSSSTAPPRTPPRPPFSSLHCILVTLSRHYRHFRRLQLCAPPPQRGRTAPGSTVVHAGSAVPPACVVVCLAACVCVCVCVCVAMARRTSILRLISMRVLWRLFFFVCSVT